MKRILFSVLLSVTAIQGMAQTNSIFGVYAGGGLAMAHNYDVALSGGLEYSKAIFERTWLGASVFYQGYGLLYDKEANGQTRETGSAGVTILHKSAFVFLAPKLSHDLGKKGFLKAYINGGIGFNMGGTETMHKWERSFGASVGNYDSVINTTANIKKMAVRVGVGLTEYIHMNGKWWFTVTEDFGVLPGTLSATSDVNYPSRTSYTPSKMAPGYISLQIGISRTKY